MCNVRRRSHTTCKANDIVMRGETSNARRYRLSSIVLDCTNYGGDPQPRYKSKKVKVHVAMSISQMFRIHPWTRTFLGVLNKQTSHAGKYTHISEVNKEKNALSPKVQFSFFSENLWIITKKQLQFILLITSAPSIFMDEVNGTLKKKVQSILSHFIMLDRYLAWQL